MNMRVDFWRTPADWPRDSANNMFLGRAVDVVGRFYFPNEWDGSETTVELYQSLPLFPKSAGGAEYFAHNLLMKHRPDFERQPLVRRAAIAGFSPIPPTVSFTSEEWDAARQIVKDHNATLAPKLGRFGKAQNQIIHWAEVGDLPTLLRAKAGGDFALIPPVWWNTERNHQRFDFCQLNPSKPFGLGSAGDAYMYIFVDRASLERLTTVTKPEQSAPAQRLPLKSDAEDAYRAYVQSFEGKKSPSRDDDEAHFKGQFGLNRQRIRALREKLAPSEWSKAGTRPKKKR